MSGPPGSILEGALAILREPDPHAKAALAESLAARCRTLPLRPAAANADDADASAVALAVPNTPARPPLATTEPSRTGRRGRGGTAESRAKMLHALVHIESWAIDLAADLVARFAAAAAASGDDADGGAPFYPRALAEDFCLVAADEARHFRLLEARLRAVHPEGRGYGAFPVHDGLWESAARTALALPARLAVEHCVHEARGLDVLPATIARFRAGGDDGTADLLENVVYGEEVAHCAAGVRWLAWAHARASGSGEREAMRRAAAAAGPPVAWSSAAAAAVEGAGEGEGGAQGEEGAGRDGGGPPPARPLARPPGREADWRADARSHASPALWFRALVARHFHGGLKPPFNEAARTKAGLTREWYWPADADGGGGGGGGGGGVGAEEEEEEEEEATAAAASAGGGGSDGAAAAAAAAPPRTPPELGGGRGGGGGGKGGRRTSIEA
jgi:uncharacterized ferritin-like protein (DUF455 family)